jgi:Flp pilus assembly pilin Flp
MNNPYLAQFASLEPGRAYRPRLLRDLALPMLGSAAAAAFASLPVRLRSERGAATAEYAITTLAAVGFAGLLVVVLRSGEVRGMLTDIVRSALSIPS